MAACSSEPGAVELSEPDGGTTQKLEVGQQLRIALEANPSTGYAWAIDGEVPAQLEQVGEPEFTAGSEAIGAGGTEIWTFVARERGSAPVSLKYWRSFEAGVPPIATFSVDVEVH